MWVKRQETLLLKVFGSFADLCLIQAVWSPPVLQHCLTCSCFIYNINFIRNAKVIILSAAFLFHLSGSSGGQLQHHHWWDIDGQQRVRILTLLLSLGDAHRQAHREQRTCPTVLQPEFRQQQVSPMAHLSPVSWKDIWICRDWRYLFKASVVACLVYLHSTQCKHGEVIHF